MERKTYVRARCEDGFGLCVFSCVHNQATSAWLTARVPSGGLWTCLGCAFDVLLTCSGRALDGILTGI